jgi:peptide/nickel transport system permease protein
MALPDTPPTGLEGPLAPMTETGPANGYGPGLQKLRLLVRMPVPLTAACLLSLIVLAAVIGAPFAFNPANAMDLTRRLAPPFHLHWGWQYLLGSDGLGRPLLDELVYGARTSFLVAGIAVTLSAVIGTVIGVVSGYYGGWLDTAVMRVGDVLVTLPSLLLALAVLFVLSPSMINLCVVLAITRLPVYMRTARAQTLTAKERVFIEAARAIGARSSRIIIRDIRPLVLPTILTVSMLEIANVILAAAGLSFLGVGLQRPDVDWGTMISEGRQYIASAWWVTVWPGLAIAVTALLANILSNWLRAVGDPLMNGMLTASVNHEETL